MHTHKGQFTPYKEMPTNKLAVGFRIGFRIA